MTPTLGIARRLAMTYILHSLLINQENCLPQILRLDLPSLGGVVVPGQPRPGIPSTLMYGPIGSMLMCVMVREYLTSLVAGTVTRKNFLGAQ